MAIVGALARIDVRSAGDVLRALAGLEGVSPLDVDQPEKIGVLIEAETLDDAYETLRTRIEGTEGVLGAWPVYVHLEDEAEPASSDSMRI